MRPCQDQGISDKFEMKILPDTDTEAISNSVKMVSSLSYFFLPSFYLILIGGTGKGWVKLLQTGHTESLDVCFISNWPAWLPRLQAPGSLQDQLIEACHFQLDQAAFSTLTGYYFDLLAIFMLLCFLQKRGVILCFS